MPPTGVTSLHTTSSFSCIFDDVVSTYNRLTAPPEESFFLFGMRGAGKSTWARETFPDADYVDLLDERLYQDLLADPSLFAQYDRALGDRRPGGHRPSGTTPAS